MGRDLACAGYTFDDVCDRLPFDQFVDFVTHAPPGTAVFHELGEGWTVNDHLQAQAIDALNLLVWSKTEDAQKKHPRHRPKPVPRPGMKQQQPQSTEHQVMTIGEYLKLSNGEVR